VSASIIELADLTKKYGSFTAVDHLNLEIRKGEVFGLLGPNGAGKSTTILMMLGLTEPTSGSVRVCQTNSSENPIEVKRKVGYLPEDVGFYPDRSGWENLLFIARLNGLSPKVATERAETLLKRVDLFEQANKKAGTYSRGMRQRLGLAEVLIKNPEVIILDEPTTGIDPKGVQEFLELIVQLSKEEGITVLFSSHNLHQVQQVCDRVGIFVRGKLIAEGNIHGLSQQLFENEPFTIYAEISSLQTAASCELTKQLEQLDGLINLQQNGQQLQLGCSFNISDKIAQTIVESGAGLLSLYKQEHGLDDIYNRYFQGGDHA
jgi:ABC-2 type transport system ATP-binding protein